MTDTTTDIEHIIRADRASTHKSDALLARREDTGDLFVIVNGEAAEWDQNGIVVVKTDGIAVRAPSEESDQGGQVLAVVNNADGLPAFVEDVVRDGQVWVVFANDAFNLCDVVDMR